MRPRWHAAPEWAVMACQYSVLTGKPVVCVFQETWGLFVSADARNVRPQCLRATSRLVVDTQYQQEALSTGLGHRPCPLALVKAQSTDSSARPSIRSIVTIHRCDQRN